MEVFNSNNIAPYPSLTTASTVSVPQTPSPTATIAVSNIADVSVTLTASSVANVIDADGVDILNSALTTVYASTLVSNIKTGYNLNTSLTASTAYAAGDRKVRFTNSRTGLTYVVNVPAFTTTAAAPTIAFTSPLALATGTIPSGYSTPTDVVGDGYSGFSANTITVQWATNITPDSYTMEYSSGTGSSGTWTAVTDQTSFMYLNPALTPSATTVAIIGNIGFSPGTQYTFRLTATKSGTSVQSLLTQYYPPSLAITGTPTISSAGALSLTYTTVPSSTVTYSWANSATPSTVIGSSTVTGGTISSTLTGITTGQSYIITLSAAAGSGSGSGTTFAKSSAILYPGSVATANLVGSYDFANTSSYNASTSATTVNDLSTASNTLTLTNQGTLTTSPKSMPFLANTKALSAALSYTFNTTGFTLEALFKISPSCGTYKTIFASANSVDTNPNICISTYNNNTTLYIWTGSANFILTGQTITNNTWYHVVFACAGSSGAYQWYVNGTAVTPTTSPDNPAPNGGTSTTLNTLNSTANNKIAMGDRLGNSGGFIGNLSLARIYTRQLTTSEVQTNYAVCKNSDSTFGLP